MGNALAINPCFRGESSAVTIISYGGATRILTGRKRLAGEIMFEFPDRMVCHADSFFIGRPIPSLAIGDELLPGETYFLLPLDCGAARHGVLSASSLATLGSNPNTRRIGSPSSSSSAAAASAAFKECPPFEYVKGSDGRIMIKVAPAFIARLISRDDSESGKNGFLCSTPELRKHYDQLVGCRDQIWSPRLETISEHKIRVSPCRFLGLEWKQKEVEG